MSIESAEMNARMPVRLVDLALLASGLACGGGSRHELVEDTSSTGVMVADSSGGTAQAERLDVAGPAGMSGGDSASACQGVDLLFVIDNSSSMTDEQVNLAENFAALIDELGALLPGVSLQVGVTTTEPVTNTRRAPCLAPRYGNFADGKDGGCLPPGSTRPFLASGDDIASAFPCLASLGAEGDGDEHTMDALIGALSSDNACNEGFVRRDAVLFVVLVTDEEDDPERQLCGNSPVGSAGMPAAWFEAVRAAKGGIETNVVALALVGIPGDDTCLLREHCIDGVAGAEPAPRIIDFTERFTHGWVAPICADYGAVLSEAASVIRDSCDAFTPEG